MATYSLMANPLIAIAIFGSKTDKRPVQHLLPWAKIVTQLSSHEEREEKDGTLFSPTLYRKGASRAKQNVQAVSCLVLDFDDGVSPDAITAAWRPYEYLIYSTFSHTDQHPKWRAVFPLTEQVSAADWPRVYHNLATVLGQGHTDRSCKDASRIYYLPSCPLDAIRFIEHHAGKWLDASSFTDVAPDPEIANETEPTRIPINRIDPETLISRALDQASGEGRNNAGLWLACQLRDNGFNQTAAEGPMQQYQQRVPQEPDAYTWDEALHSLEQAYTQPAREAWGQGRPFDLNGHAQPEDVSTALEIARAATAALSGDRGAIFLPDAIQALARIRRWDPVNWARLTGDVKKHGLLRDLEQRLNRLREEPAEHEPRPRLAGDMLDDCPAPQLIIPSPYVLKDNATGRIVETENGSEVATITLAPVVLLGRAYDTLTRQESLLMAWRWLGSAWRSELVERSRATVGRKLSDLADLGFPYLDGQSAHAADYISRLEAANRLSLPTARISSHLAWQGPSDDAPFLLGSNLILPDGTLDTAGALDTDHPETWDGERVMFHALGDGEQQIVSSFHTAGTYDAWAEAIHLLTPYPRAMAVFYAAFAAPLLDVFNVPNFVIDISHATTTGKTTTLRAAGSIYGNPDERTPTSVVWTWDVTRVFLERLSHVVTGLPVLLDDTKKARNPQIVADLIYALASGRGRGRGTVRGIASTAYWRSILISTGEQPATSFTQDGGTRTRVLSIRGLPLGKRDQDTGALAKRVNRQLVENYGHAGLRWVQWLMREKPLWDKWRARYEEWVEYYSANPATPEAGRLAQYAALVTIAGSMAHQALSLPWEYANPIRQIWQELASEASDAAGEERALRDVISWAYSHERTFHNRTSGEARHFGGIDASGPAEVAGRWDTGEWKFIAFFQHVLRRVLVNEGYQPEAILVGWRDRGWLDHQPNRFTTKVRVGTSTPHMVKIWRAAVDALESDDREQPVTE